MRGLTLRGFPPLAGGTADDDDDDAAWVGTAHYSVEGKGCTLMRSPWAWGGGGRWRTVSLCLMGVLVLCFLMLVAALAL
eukprot:gene47620-62337_t